MITVKNITGWKWDDADGAASAVANCDAFFEGIFGIPGNLTNKSFIPRENRNSLDELEFYFVGYNKQLEQVLGEPTNFDINVIMPE